MLTSNTPNNLFNCITASYVRDYHWYKCCAQLGAWLLSGQHCMHGLEKNKWCIHPEECIFRVNLILLIISDLLCGSFRSMCMSFAAYMVQTLAPSSLNSFCLPHSCQIPSSAADTSGFSSTLMLILETKKDQTPLLPRQDTCCGYLGKDH